jgi:hypothetical protein
MSFYSTISEYEKNPKAMIYGKMLHALLLEGVEAYEVLKLQEKSRYSDEIFATTMKEVNELYKKMSATTKLSILSGCQTEVVGIWEGKIFKRPRKLKSKFDGINIERKYIVDLKSISGLSNFGKQLRSFNYHIQAAFYCRISELLFGEKFDYYWLVVEKKTGRIALHKCSEELLIEGNDLIDNSFASAP